MHLKRAFTAVAVLLLVSRLGACSSSKSEPTSGSARRGSARDQTTTSVGAASPTESANTSTTATSSPNATAGQPTAPIRVSIKDFSFNPAMVKTTVGTEVTFVNNDGEFHTATSDSAAPVAFDSNQITPGDAKGFSVRFDKPGTYSYHCKIHPSMHGTVEVS